MDTVSPDKTQVPGAKIPPHSLEAEKSIIGGLLIDSSSWDSVAEAVVAEDFYRHEHRVIFRAMRELIERGSPLDPVTLAEFLTSSGDLDKVGGLAQLLQLSKDTPSAANAKAYAAIVRERSIFRQLLGAVNNIAKMVYNPEGRDSSALLDNAESQVFQIAERGARGDGPLAIQKVLAGAVQRIDQLFRSDSVITGMATGFTDLDDMTAGLQKGDLVIIAGRPSMGKTTFVMNMVEHVAIKEQKPVLVFSLEMPAESLVMRLMSSLGRIEQHTIRTGKLNADDWDRFSSAVSLLSNTKLYIDETPGISPTELRARARRVMREHGEIGLIAVDYLQLMQVAGSKENRTNEISEISRSLKMLAKELGVPVVALSQLNRELEHRPNKRPIMSDLRESGAIEQDADLIGFIYRDEVYNKETEDKGKAEVIIAKQRNGPIGTTYLAFLGQYCRFENLANYHGDDY